MHVSNLGTHTFEGGSEPFPSGATGTYSAQVVILTDSDNVETGTVELTVNGQVVASRSVAINPPGESRTLSGTVTIPGGDFDVCAHVV